jgi:CDP-glucose 4,6-dehydratase
MDDVVLIWEYSLDVSRDRLSSIANLPGPILLTGHTGFKGTWMTLLLEKLGVRTIGYSLPPQKDSLFDRANRAGLITEEFADIRDIERLKAFVEKNDPSAIVHMAAQPLVLDSYRIPRETFEINVMGTANILDIAFQKKNIEAVLVVTTDKVYQNNNLGKAFVETDPLGGKDPYSASKVGTEAVVAAWQQIQKASGGPKVASVRAGNVIGGGDWATDRLLPDLIRGFIFEKKIIVRNSGSTRPWQHVLDPLHGYLLALNGLLANQEIKSLNFGPQEESLTVKNVAEIAGQAWPGTTDIEETANDVEEKTEALYLNLNSSLAQETLYWKALWSQEEAISSTVNWWVNVVKKNMDPNTACFNDIDKILNALRKDF